MTDTQVEDLAAVVCNAFAPAFAEASGWKAPRPYADLPEKTKDIFREVAKAVLDYQEDRANMSESVVFVIEVDARTQEDLDLTVAAIREGLQRSPVAERVKMTLAIKDSAERVLRALDGP